jgi:membrane-bound lytic murein transglycosylase B
VTAVLSVLGSQSSLGQTAADPSADGAAQATLQFQECLRAIEAQAETRGISKAIYEHLRVLSPRHEVLNAVQSQAEFETPIWEYIDASVTDTRITNGQGKLAEWSPLLDAVEARFGVDRHILLAIWGIESSYGTVLEDLAIVKPVVQSLATLACNHGPRAAFWRDELLTALQLLEKGDATPKRMTGSWAGAMGHTQFMPTTYQSHAIDFDGDGKRDLWHSVPDALASTANYLRSLGWRSGETWGYEVELPQGFDYSLADERTERPLSDWLSLGARLAHNRQVTAAQESAVLVLPTGARGPAFLLTPNFRVILRYNTALAYGLSVAHLSDRLRGEPPFVRSWPRSDRMLTKPEREELQTLLAQRGFDPGPVDGKVGPKTRAAIRTYQASIGILPDGYAEAALLERIRPVQ